MDDLIKALERTRPGFDDEAVWMKFLSDSYNNSGGYQTRAKQPSYGYWGAAAEAYAGWSVHRLLSSSGTTDDDTYLDRHPREDLEKFHRRRAVAHQRGYVSQLTDLKISYLVRKPLTRTSVPPKLQRWIDLTGYERDFRKRALSAAIFGWFPVVVDTKDGVPYVVESLPMELRNYAVGADGSFDWAVTCHERREQPTWDAPAVRVRHFVVWTRTTLSVYVLRGETNVAVEVVKDNAPNPFGTVPIVSWRASPALGEPIKAPSLIGNVAIEARRLYNLISLADEHVSSQVFALLILPRMVEASEPGSVEVGTENGVVVSPEQKNVPFYLAPPASVADTLAAQIATSVVEIHRLARVEYVKASGANTSAASKAQEFAATNAAISDLGRSLAIADRETLMLVGRALDISENELSKMTVSAADSYNEDSLAEEIDSLVEIVTRLPVGGAMTAEVMKRLGRRLIPNADPQLRRAIDADIEEEITSRRNRDAQERALLEGDDN